MKKHLALALASALFLFSCNKPGNDDGGGNPPATPTVSSLNCASATVSNSALAGESYSGTVSVPYSGGNNIVYGPAGPIASTGVTGLSATLQTGQLTSSGSLVYTISGTPAGEGTAQFAISFGGQSCSFSLPVTADGNFTQYGTPFNGVPDRPDAAIYQVNMRAFSGPGSFSAVTARLDSIKALGINVVYLMPIYPVGAYRAVNSPYAVRDYRAVNPEFGTLNDLRTLVDGAHSRGMSVILDWVANHTAWDHPWLTQHSDWYLTNSQGVITSPPGMGWDDAAQLNFSNAAMRLAMIRSMKYWVYAANIDGFRFDYADGPPASFWKQAVDTLRNITTHKLLLLAEGNRADHFSSGFDYTFGFNFYGRLRSIHNGGSVSTNLDAVNTSEYQGAANDQQVVRYTSNHDINGSDGTPLELFGGQPGSMATFVVAAFMKGVPMVYNGQEVGLNYRLTFPFTGADINWTLNPGLKEEYKRLLNFRSNSAALRRGTLTSYSNTDLAAFTRELGGEKVFVVSNLRNSAQVLNLPASLQNTTWTNVMTGASITLGTQVPLAGYGYLVLRN